MPNSSMSTGSSTTSVPAETRTPLQAVETLSSLVLRQMPIFVSPQGQSICDLREEWSSEEVEFLCNVMALFHELKNNNHMPFEECESYLSTLRVMLASGIPHAIASPFSTCSILRELDAWVSWEDRSFFVADFNQAWRYLFSQQHVQNFVLILTVAEVFLGTAVKLHRLCAESESQPGALLEHPFFLSDFLVAYMQWQSTGTAQADNMVAVFRFLNQTNLLQLFQLSSAEAPTVADLLTVLCTVPGSFADLRSLHEKQLVASLSPSQLSQLLKQLRERDNNFRLLFNLFEVNNWLRRFLAPLLVISACPASLGTLCKIFADYPLAWLTPNCLDQLLTPGGNNFARIRAVFATLKSSRYSHLSKWLKGADLDGFQLADPRNVMAVAMMNGVRTNFIDLIIDRLSPHSQQRERTDVFTSMEAICQRPWLESNLHLRSFLFQQVVLLASQLLREQHVNELNSRAFALENAFFLRAENLIDNAFLNRLLGALQQELNQRTGTLVSILSKMLSVKTQIGREPLLTELEVEARLSFAAGWLLVCIRRLGRLWAVPAASMSDIDEEIASLHQYMQKNRQGYALNWAPIELCLNFVARLPAAPILREIAKELMRTHCDLQIISSLTSLAPAVLTHLCNQLKCVLGGPAAGMHVQTLIAQSLMGPPVVAQPPAPFPLVGEVGSVTSFGSWALMPAPSAVGELPSLRSVRERPSMESIPSMLSTPRASDTPRGP